MSKAESDKFWRRMSYSMGGAAKSNVGFPLLTLVKPPVAVDWPKMDVMRLLGYTDHLQTSRYIRDAHKAKEAGRFSDDASTRSRLPSRKFSNNGARLYGDDE